MWMAVGRSLDLLKYGQGKLLCFPFRCHVAKLSVRHQLESSSENGLESIDAITTNG
jgi:hypothetical protein